MDDLLTLVTLLVGLSVASERLVEIIKGFLSGIPYLSLESGSNEKCKLSEPYRRMVIQLLAVACGLLTAFLARPAISSTVPEIFQTTSGVVALGLLASGGSGFWNAILAYVLQAKSPVSS